MVYNGRYLELQEVEEGLKLTLTPDGREEITDLSEAQLDDEVLVSLLRDHLGNGWDFIPPEDIGAMTSGGILVYDVERDDENKIVHIGQVYWDSEYQVQSSVEQLKAGKSVTWQRAGEWAAKNEKAEEESPTHESGGLMAIAVVARILEQENKMSACVNPPAVRILLRSDDEFFVASIQPMPGSPDDQVAFLAKSSRPIPQTMVLAFKVLDPTRPILIADDILDLDGPAHVVRYGHDGNRISMMNPEQSRWVEDHSLVIVELNLLGQKTEHEEPDRPVSIETQFTGGMKMLIDIVLQTQATFQQLDQLLQHGELTPQILNMARDGIIGITKVAERELLADGLQSESPSPTNLSPPTPSQEDTPRPDRPRPKPPVRVKRVQDPKTAERSRAVIRDLGEAMNPGSVPPLDCSNGPGQEIGPSVGS